MCRHTLYTKHRLSSPIVLPPLALCFSYITARCLRPNLHFSSFAPRSVFFYSLLFSPPLLSLAFQPPFVAGEGWSEDMKGGRMWMPGSVAEEHTWPLAAAALAAISQLSFSRWCFLVLIKQCCEVNQRDAESRVFGANLRENRAATPTINRRWHWFCAIKISDGSM